MDYPGQNVDHEDAEMIPGDLFRERIGRGLCVLCGESSPCHAHRPPDPAYAKMTDSQLSSCQDRMDEALEGLEGLDRDWTPTEEALYPRYQQDSLDIEREQAARWRAYVDRVKS